ncbi:MAG: hypothetical protein D9V47_06835 [Clostridia bacterium]|nr:MAG: hypothetical protein D9V47_06835 [Clostridia bacterium]
MQGVNGPVNGVRGITKVYVVEGDLVLESPACPGSGDREGLTDIQLQLDPLEGRALITGASLAGALRSYLREREYGYRQPERPDGLASRLFGFQGPEGLANRDQAEMEESYLIVNDALSLSLQAPGGRPGTEIRDGVAIDPATRTAKEDHKFELELLEAGTSFPLHFELHVDRENEADLVRALAVALQGLERGEIALGARKSRGFGRCRVRCWRACTYDLATPDGLIQWLEGIHNWEKGQPIDLILGATGTDFDRRQLATLIAKFRVNGSVMIRAATADPGAPDAVHLQSNRRGSPRPVISGTSLAGALRARATRIALTMAQGPEGEDRARQLVEDLFGPPTEARVRKASRVITEETELKNGRCLVQRRIKIDRFTGGTYPGALFAEQPVFGTAAAEVTLQLAVLQPGEADLGLLLLLLKDLWTGDLPIGGGVGVGRGRLEGIEAVLQHGDVKCTFRQERTALTVDGTDRNILEGYLQAFLREVGHQ